MLLKVRILPHQLPIHPVPVQMVLVQMVLMQMVLLRPVLRYPTHFQTRPILFPAGPLPPDFLP